MSDERGTGVCTDGNRCLRTGCARCLQEESGGTWVAPGIHTRPCGEHHPRLSELPRAGVWIGKSARLNCHLFLSPLVAKSAFTETSGKDRMNVTPYLHQKVPIPVIPLSELSSLDNPSIIGEIGKLFAKPFDCLK